MTHNSHWTDDAIATLCAGHGDGHSYAVIAERLGRTRNATIGKFDRLRREGHGPAIEADARRPSRDALPMRVADWIAEHGGSVAECADQLGAHRQAVVTAWKRIRRGLGWQAS